MFNGATFQRTSSSDWPSQQLQSKYIIKRIIDSGNFGTVYQGMNIRTKEIVALKEIRHTVQDKGISVLALREIEILKRLHCDQIVSFKEVMYGPRRTYIVMEYMPEDLFISMQKEQFSEAQIRIMMIQILKGLAYLHQRNITHRDIKPNNILRSDTQIKICDLGMAKIFDPIKKQTSRVQNCNYRAPEVFLGQIYDTKIDMWSVGVLVLELLLRFNPFRAQSEALTFEKILRVCGSPNEGTPCFILETWPGVSMLKNYSLITQIFSNNLSQVLEKKMSPHLVELVTRMLTLNPAQRISAQEALEHPYFRDVRIPKNCTLQAKQSQKKVKTDTLVLNDQQGNKIIVVSKIL